MSVWFWLIPRQTLVRQWVTKLRLLFERLLTNSVLKVKAGLRVTALDATGVTLSNGEKIETETVIWTAGMRANPLASQIAGEKDNLGRLIGDAYLHAPEAKTFL